MANRLFIGYTQCSDYDSNYKTIRGIRQALSYN